MMEITKEIREELAGAFSKSDILELEEINANLFQKDEYIDADADDIDLKEYIKIDDGSYRHKGFIKQGKIVQKILEDLDTLSNWIAACCYADDGTAGIGLIYLNDDYSIKWDEQKKQNLKEKISFGTADIWLSHEYGDEEYFYIAD